MTFSDLFNVMDADVKIAIDFQYERYSYTVEELKEDFVFYEEIKDRDVDSVWYSHVYDAIIIELR